MPALEKASKDSAHEVRTVARNTVQRLQRLQTARNTVFSAGTGGATVIAVDYGYDTHTK